MTTSSTSSGTDRIAATCGRYIDDFQRLFKFHNIYTGHLENFSRLSSALTSKQYFSSDFFSLADAIRRKEEGGLSDADMLTIIALALGGPDVGDANAINVPMGFLHTFTTGMRAWSEAPLPQHEAPFPQHEAPLPQQEAPFSQHEDPLPQRQAPLPHPAAAQHASAPPPLQSPPPHQQAPPLPQPVSLYPGHEPEPHQHAPPPHPSYAPLSSAPLPPPPYVPPSPAPPAFQSHQSAPPAPSVQPQEPTAFPPADALPPIAPRPVYSAPAGPLPVNPPPPAQAPAPQFMAPQPLPPAQPLNPRLDGTLERLEITSRQLKDHLESIEQRISRIEPQLEELPPTPPAAQPSAAPAPVAATIAEPAPKPATPLTLRHKGEALQLTPTTAPVFTSFLGSVPDSASASYDDDEENPWPNRSMFLLAFFAILLAVAGAFCYRYYVNHDGHVDIRQILHLASAQAPAPVSSPIPTPATQTNGPPPTAPGTPAAPLPAPESVLTPTGPVQVPSGIILRNGISTPRPSYASSARAAKIQGPVAVDLLITKNGNVQSLHAVSGPEELRPAVVRAVRSWHFKPYLVNGQPVAVSTHLTFIFKSDWIYPTVESDGSAAQATEAPQP